MLFEKESGLWTQNKADRYIRVKVSHTADPPRPLSQSERVRSGRKADGQSAGHDLCHPQRYSRIERPQSIVRRTHQHGPR